MTEAETKTAPERLRFWGGHSLHLHTRGLPYAYSHYFRKIWCGWVSGFTMMSSNKDPLSASKAFEEATEQTPLAF